MMSKHSWAACLLLLLPSFSAAREDVGAAGGGEGQAVTSAGSEAENKQEKFPVGAQVIYDNSLGIGAFMANEYARNYDWAMSLSVRPRLTLWNKLSLGVRVDVQKYLTTSYQGTANADTSVSSYVRQLTISDVIVGASMPEIYREPSTGIGFNAGFSLYLPTSMLSRSTNQITAVRPSVGVDWSWEGLSLSYNLSFKKNFNTTVNPTHNVAYLPGSLQFRPGGAEDLGGGEIASPLMLNTSHIAYNYAAVEYTFLEVLTASASLYIINSFKYPLQRDDDYTSKYAINTTKQVDSTWGTIELGYNPWQSLGFAVGINSLQSAYTADNKGFRFPFFDFVSTADNNTGMYFSVVGTI